MKLYTFQFDFKIRMDTAEIFWQYDNSFIHIVAKNKPLARKAALNRFNRYLNKNWCKKYHKREILDIKHIESKPIGTDGFIDIYL